MAEPLKNSFGDKIPKTMAKNIKAVYAKFDEQKFINQSLIGYDALSLTQRSQNIADALSDTLPESIPKAIQVLTDSLGPKLESTDEFGMTSFYYMPFIQWVGQYAVDYFDEAMAFQYDVTQRFTAEFSVRAFIEKYPDESWGLFKKWVSDDSAHVRRLVSEGTRPRLPWAGRLRKFQEDPTPVIELLELLKNDSELYVRRSVANNLNDISKDNPQVVAEVATRWYQNGDKNQRWIVKHALRSAIKRNESWALKVLGYHHKANVDVGLEKPLPQGLAIGDSFQFQFSVSSQQYKLQAILVDFSIEYMKANGQLAKKVFKLKTIEIEEMERQVFKKKISFADMSTRKHYPGLHRVNLLVNGHETPLGEFELHSGD